MALGNNFKKNDVKSDNNDKSTHSNSSSDVAELRARIEELEKEKQGMQGIVDTVNVSYASIEFDTAGTILNANTNFLKSMGYPSIDLIRGKHHRIFVEPAYATSNEYLVFWKDLYEGKVLTEEFKRIKSNGEVIWLQATYSPVKDEMGHITKVVKIAQDITQQVKMREEAKQAAEELKAQEEELRQNMEEMEATQEEVQRAGAEMKGVLDAINQSYAYIEFDTKGNIQSANENFLKTLNYTAEDLKGKHHRIFVDPIYANGSEYANFWIDLANGKVNAGQFKRITKTGQEVWIQAAYSPVKDNAGNVTKVIKIATDITADIKLREEAKQASEELKAQEEELRQNIEEMEATQEEIQRASAEMKGVLDAINASFAYIEFDTKGNIQSANENFLTRMEYSSEEIKGRHHRMFVEPTYANSNEYANFWTDLANGKVNTGQFKRISKSGQDIYLQAAYSPVKDNAGNITKIIKIATDITEEKEAAAQMQREIDARMASVDQACIVSEVDLKGYITYVNDKHCEVSQYTREELIGANQNIVRHPDMPKELFKEMWATIGKGKIFKGLVKNRRKDGTPYYVDGVFTPILGKNGKPVKYIGIRYDITETTYEQQAMKGVVDAIDSSYAFIEFDTKGIIQTANDNFLKTMEYSIDDIKGKHHRMFVEPAYANSTEYTRFWDELATGKVQNDQYKRITRSGKEVWLQAVYSPVKDEMGRITKVVKIASDITAQKQIINEVNNVVELAGKEGKLNARVNASGVTGDFKVLSESLNTLLDNIASPVLEASRIINKMAQGDLTERINVTAKGDIGAMADSLNTALNNLNKLLSNISHIANLVASSSEELLTKGEQMKNTTQEVASATQQMAEGAQQQAQQTDDVSKLTEEVLKSANDMGRKAELINSSAALVQKNSSEGLITIRRVVENMNEIQSSASTTSDSIKILTERAEDIARTLNVITDIAAQTNLLALNAAIEAARAGDAGRGFAVVAEEIRKLAEDSKKSAIDIEKVIREVQKDVNSASKSIDSMEASVKSGNQASKEAEVVFVSIDKSSLESLESSKEILQATNLQKESINETVKNIEKIVVVSEETASGTEQIASSTKELSQGMNEVTATSKDLADVASQLQEGVSSFKLNL
ncbi:MAG: PAS domain S-box protein [Bacteroidota bacterium]